MTDRKIGLLVRVREGGKSFAMPHYAGGFWRGRGAGARERARAIFARPRRGARERGTEGDGRFASIGDESRIYFPAACGEKSKQAILMQRHVRSSLLGLRAMDKYVAYNRTEGVLH